MKRSFKKWQGSAFSARDTPDLSQVKSMREMFCYAGAFNGDLSNWNVSNIVIMKAMFKSASSFNQNIGRWKIRKVEDMNLSSINQNRDN